MSWLRLELRLATMLTGLAVAALPTCAQPAVFAASFDCAASHPFAGFGLNAFPLGQRIDALASLVQELHVKWLRWPVLPNMEAADIPESSSFDGLVNWLDRTTLDQQSPRLALFDRMRSLGVEQLAVSYRPPVKWRVGGEKVLNGKPNNRLAEDRIDAYARLLAAELVIMKQHGVVPNAIELLNEPVNKIPPPDYARLFASFRGWQQRERLTATNVAGPGTVFTWDNPPYLNAMASQRLRLDIISTHAYDPIKTHQLTGLRPLLGSIPAGQQVPLFVTEYGIDTKIWFSNNLDAVNAPAYGVLAAAATLSLLESGANAVFYWQAQDPPWEKPPYWGLLSKEDKRRPAVDALRTIIQPLEVGDRIASSGRQDPPLPLMLAARPGQLVLEVANPTPEPQEYRITFQNCSTAPITPTKTTVWPADRMLQVQPLSPTSIQITVAGDTVASIATTR